MILLLAMAMQCATLFTLRRRGGKQLQEFMGALICLAKGASTTNTCQPLPLCLDHVQAPIATPASLNELV